MLIPILNSIFIFFIAIYYAFNLARNRIYIPLISFTLIAIGIIYGLGSSIVFYASSIGMDFLGSDIIYSRSEYWSIYSIFTLCLIFSIILGWRSPNLDVKYLKNYFSYTTKQFLFIAYVILLLGVILRWIYVQAFGGFLGYLEYSRLIRSGIFELNNPYSFLQPFGYLVVLSCYMFLSIFLKNKKNIYSFLGFILALCSSCYVLYSNVGRVAFLSFIASLFLIGLYYKKVKPFKIITFIIILFPLVFFFLYVISNYFEVKGADNPFIYFVKETSFVFSTFLIQYTDGNLFRFFIDFIIAPIHFLPSSLTQNIYETASQTNTILFYGAKKGEEGVTGGIPVDLLSLSIMQANIFGIVPVGFLFGFLLRFFDNFICEIENIYLRISLLPYISLRVAFLGLLYSQADHFISGLFPIVILFMLLVFVKVLFMFLPKN